MLTMKQKEIEEIFDHYLEGKIAEDPDFLDNVTDSWIFDAEDWFWSTYKLPDWDEPKDKPKELTIFSQYALKRFNETYREKYGERDAMDYLPIFKFEVEVLSEKFRTELKPYFDNWRVTDAIALRFNELIEELDKITIK